MRVVIADDAVLLREGLIRLLAETGHDVVAAVGDGPSLVTAVIEHKPDVSIVSTPPAARTRSARPDRPWPLDTCAPPTPLSRISMSR